MLVKYTLYLLCTFIAQNSVRTGTKSNGSLQTSVKYKLVLCILFGSKVQRYCKASFVAKLLITKIAHFSKYSNITVASLILFFEEKWVSIYIQLRLKSKHMLHYFFVNNKFQNKSDDNENHRSEKKFLKFKHFLFTVFSPLHWTCMKYIPNIYILSLLIFARENQLQLRHSLEPLIINLPIHWKSFLCISPLYFSVRNVCELG